MAATEQELSLAKELIWPKLNYEPHSGQRVIHASRARHRVASCGRRFGKSTIGGHELTLEALLTYTMVRQLEDTSKRREFWIVGPEYSDSEKEFRVLYDDCKRLDVPFDRPGTYNNPESGEMHISLWRGRYQVHAKSAKYPGTLVGEGLSGVVMAEAAKMKELVWTKFVRPTLADVRGWSVFNSTPEGRNWFYRLWQRGQDERQTQWESWRMPSWINTRIFPDGRQDTEVIDMEADMSTERFNQEVGASFTDFVGQVFKDFDEEVHVTNLVYDERYPLYAAIDYGWTNPFVWLLVQVDVWDNVFVIGEYRAQNRDINDIAADLAAYPINGQVKMMYPDPAEPGDTAVLNKKLRIPYAGNTGGELKWRLELIRQHLKLLPVHLPIEQRKPRLYIDRSCQQLIREMQDYRYPETKEESLLAPKEEPVKKDDHGPEALGRFMRGYYGGPGDTTGGKARVRKANMT
jgi:hypothetical protein